MTNCSLLAELREHLAKVDALQVKRGCVLPGRRPAWCVGSRSSPQWRPKHGQSRRERNSCHEDQRAPMFARYNVTSDEDLRAVAERIGMSSRITEAAAAKTRLVSVRSS
jgi:hypothetical protein